MKCFIALSSSTSSISIFIRSKLVQARKQKIHSAISDVKKVIVHTLEVKTLRKGGREWIYLR